MKQSKRLWSAVLSVSLVPGLYAVTSATAPSAAAAELVQFHETKVLGTSMDLVVNAATKENADAVRTAIMAEIKRLDGILSVYEPGSELAKVNATLEPVKVSPELIEVLSLYDQWQAKSGGAFSGQVGSLKKLWADGQAANREPDDLEIKLVVARMRNPLWIIDRAAGTVKRMDDQAINVDSLGKGFIVSKALEAGKKLAPAGILLNIGGDISVTGFGEPDRKVKWSVRVADPASPADNAKPLTEVRLTDLAIATSGHGARGFNVDGKNYSHIFDPRTGKPVGVTASGKPAWRGVAAATVIAPDNATANALATSVCVLGVEKGLELVKSVKGAECLIVLNGGGRVRSDGFKKYEVPHGEGMTNSDIALSDGTPWPAQYVVDIDVPVTEGARERPYVAVWIEDDQHQHVKTLQVWGNEERWLRQMDFWWDIGKTDLKYVPTVTRPTRDAGQYKLAWDGTDRFGRRVPQGTYTVWVEVSYEHGHRVGKSQRIDCGPAAKETTLAPTDNWTAAKISYGQTTGKP